MGLFDNPLSRVNRVISVMKGSLNTLARAVARVPTRAAVGSGQCGRRLTGTSWPINGRQDTVNLSRLLARSQLRAG